MISVFVVGNVTKDLEIKTVGEKDNKICNFQVASNRISDKEKADFISVEVWNGQAENCAKYLSKGSGVAVSGDLIIDEYEKDGIKQYRPKVVNCQVQFTDKKK